MIKVPAPAQREARSDDGPRIAVSEFVISYEEPDAIAATYRQSTQVMLGEFLAAENYQLSIGQLDQAADKVTDHLRAAGFLLAKAILPPQEVERGAIHLRVFAGIVGGVAAQANKLYATDDLTQPFARLEGQPVVRKTLESRLIKLNELPGLSAIALFQPGINSGETTLALQAVNETPITYSARIDNHGVEATGDWRAALGVKVNNVTGHRDRLAVDAIKTTSPGDLRNARVNYEITSSKLVHTLGLGFSETRYDVEAPGAKPLNIEGDTEIADAYVYSRWLSSRPLNVSTRIGMATKRAEVEFFGGATSDGVDRLAVLTAMLVAEGVDQKFRGLYRGSIGLHRGFNDVLGSMDGNGNGNSLTKVNSAPQLPGQFRKLTASYNRLQTVSRYQSLLLLFAGQYSSDPLSSLEKMSLGGPYTVRAYPTGEFTGERGIFTSLGWVINGGLFSNAIAFGEYSWSDILSVTVFADYGWAKNRDGSGGVTRRELSGAGLGSRWQFPEQRAFIDFSYAVPFAGHKANNGDDGQVWFQAGIDF
ncbi:MAG: ShlB/FhaC/HecB family hemolysin secretion/activation protein [Pseudomonadales bacterium]|nr:ShlB/FhaC/HecB family hemolysin secretion/activation protein [Pseudomonadales bacterium]